MATYNAVSASEKDADSIVDENLIDKLDQNVEGAFSGLAPFKLLNAALPDDVITNRTMADNAVGNDELISPIAGTAHVILRLSGDTGLGTNQSSYPSVDSGKVGAAYNRQQAFNCLVSGTITVSVDHVDTIGLAYLRVVKNGSVVAEWSNFDGVLRTRQVAVSVSVGDLILIQQRTNALDSVSTMKNIRVYSNNDNFAVA